MSICSRLVGSGGTSIGWSTIHQPSSSVFAKLDQLLILSGGRPAYNGAAHELATFLASVGRPVPEHTNVADCMLDAINADFVSVNQVEQLLATWADTIKGHSLSGEPSHMPLSLPAHAHQLAPWPSCCGGYRTQTGLSKNLVCNPRPCY